MDDGEFIEKFYKVMRNDEFQSMVQDMVQDRLEEYKALSKQQVVPVLDRDSWYPEKIIEQEGKLTKCHTEDIDTVLLSRVKDMCRALQDHHGLKAITMEIFTEGQLYLLTDPHKEDGLVDIYMRNGVSPRQRITGDQVASNTHLGCPPSTDPNQPGSCDPVMGRVYQFERSRVR